jgi:hypothetical protein
VRIPSGASLAYPGGWRQVAGDPGTATAVLLSADGRYLGYLNLTPRQGAETLANWTSFRPGHNKEDGDTNVVTLATATRMRFGAGLASCVRDSYATRTRARFIELACLVSGKRGSWVIIGAAPPERWASISPELERAIAAVSV